MNGLFKPLARWFFSGLLILAPAAVTIYVLVAAFLWIDGLIDVEGRLGIATPGLGFLMVVGIVTLTGYLASNFFTRWIIGLGEELFRRLPLVRLVYNAIRDLLEAFVGEKKRFDQPVLVELQPGSETRALGFVTRREMGSIGHEDKVAVYFPQSYNFAGQLLVVPKEKTQKVTMDPTDVMTFIVSGGVSGQDEAGDPGKGGGR